MATNPDHHAPSRFFYGWIIAFSLLVIYLLADGVSLALPPVLYPRFIQEFGVTEGAVSFCGAITLIIAGITAPFAGFLLDRFGPCNMIRVGVILLGLCGVFYVQAASLWQLYLLHSLLGIGLVFCGILSIVVLVSHWFVERRGMVLGLVLAGSGLSGGILPNLVAPIVSNPQYGWRWGYGLVLLLLLTLALPLSLFAIKDSPSEMGERRDGKAPVEGEKSSIESPPSSEGVAFREAARQGVFWVFALTLATLWFSVFVFHSQLIIFIKQDLGFTQEMASFCFSLIFICSVTGNFSFSAISDHFDRHRVIVFTAFLLFSGILVLFEPSASSKGFSLELTNHRSRLILFSVLFGLGYGGTFTVLQGIISIHFGPKNLGRILGTLTFIGTVGGFLGISSSGFLRTWTGNYLIPFMVVAGLCALMTVLLVFLKRLNGRLYDVKSTSSDSQTT